MYFQITEAKHLVIDHAVSTRPRAVVSYEFDLFNNAYRNIYIDAKMFAADADCIMLRKPGQIVHSIGTYDNLILTVNLTDSSNAPISMELLEQIPSLFYPVHIHELKQIASQIIHIYQADKNSPHLQQEFLRFLFLLLSDSLEETSHNLPKQTSRINKVTSYIAQHYSEAISMEYLASLIHLDKYYFIKYFKKKTGVTPQQYLIHKRIREAQTLLESVDLPIKEIAYMVGYANTTHFVSSFTKIVGVSPAQYRTRFRLPHTT